MCIRDRYAAIGLDRPRIRLVGVKCENLRGAGEVGEQLSFDDLLEAVASTTAEPYPHGSVGLRSHRSTDTVIDAAHDRFVGYATLLRPQSARSDPDDLQVSDSAS